MINLFKFQSWLFIFKLQAGGSQIVLQHNKLENHIQRWEFKNVATGETSQAIASLTNFTSIAFMTRLLLSRDNFYQKMTFITNLSSFSHLLHLLHHKLIIFFSSSTSSSSQTYHLFLIFYIFFIFFLSWPLEWH